MANGFGRKCRAIRMQAYSWLVFSLAIHYRYALRQKLLPCIEATYGDGAHRNLASLAVASDALHDEVRDNP